MTIIEQRDQAVTETVGRVRLIEQQRWARFGMSLSILLGIKKCFPEVVFL